MIKMSSYVTPLLYRCNVMNGRADVSHGELTEAQRKVFWKSTVRKDAFIYVRKFVYKNLVFPKPASQNVYYEHVK